MRVERLIAMVLDIPDVVKVINDARRANHEEPQATREQMQLAAEIAIKELREEKPDECKKIEAVLDQIFARIREGSLE